MSALSLYPTYQYSNGEVGTPAVFNNPLIALQAWSTTIDRSNMAAGAGIDASILTPSTAAAATFGGTVGYNFLAPSAGTVPLTVSGVSGQSADIFDVTLTSGGTKALAVNATGGLLLGAAATLSSSVGMSSDAGGTPGMKFSIPTASTNGYRWLVNDSSVAAQLGSNGVLSAAGQITPGYTVTGVGTASIYSGTGSPSGTVSAPNGSLFLRYDGGANAHLYINTSGASTSGTTWTAVTD